MEPQETVEKPVKRRRRRTKKVDQGTPHQEHKLAWAKKDAARKKATSVKAEWIEVEPNKTHKKGGKVVRRTLLSNGNVHTYYLGREKQVSEILNEYKAKGMVGDPRKK